MNSKCKKFYDEGFTVKGTTLMSAAELKICSKFFRENRAYVHTMEAHKVDGKTSFLDLPLGIHGMDGDENMEKHLDVDRAFKLLNTKLKQAEKSSKELKYIVWLDDWPKV